MTFNNGVVFSYNETIWLCLSRDDILIRKQLLVRSNLRITLNIKTGDDLLKKNKQEKINDAKFDC